MSCGNTERRAIVIVASCGSVTNGAGSRLDNSAFAGHSATHQFDPALTLQSQTIRTCVMDQKTFVLIAGVIFAIVALVHLLRILLGWPIVIDNWTVPMWLSWIALVIAGGLSYFGLSLVSRS
jgi:hypothetical protein